MARAGHTGQGGPSGNVVAGEASNPLTRPSAERTRSMSTRSPEAEALLTPAEGASMFRVDPRPVPRGASSAKLTSIRPLGGHRRYREAEVRALLAGIPQPRNS